MRYYLGIDGGGTKTRFALCDGRGRVVAKQTLPSCHYLQHGLPTLTSTVRTGLNDVCEQSGITMADVTYCFISCGGYGDVAEDCKKIEKAVLDGLGSIQFSVGNDCENALAGALCGKEGITLVAGTGSIGAGINSEGIFLRSGGWHYAIGGDEGSAYWIASRLLNEWLRQYDGRDKKSALFDYIRAKLGVETGEELLDLLVNVWKMDRTIIASIAPIVGILFDNGDQYAQAILDDVANNLCEIAIALRKRLNFSDFTEVSYSGGVFKLGERIIEPLRKKLCKNNLLLVPPVLPPTAGAIILAMKADGILIDSSIVNSLKADRLL